MIFQPAILALFFADLVAVPMMALTALFAVQVVRHWDLQSGSARQLRLERRTLLATTLVAFACVTQGVALLLFVYTADHLADLFTGAMCAVGSLNAAPLGFPALTLRIALFFLAASWLVVNHLDNQCPDYPLTRGKYLLLLALLPLALATALVQAGYFSGLNADVITSCCGSLFDSRGSSLSSELSAWPVRPTMAALWTALLAVVAAGVQLARHHRGARLFAVLAALAWGIALAAVVSFLSPYVYEHPHHHCPFCLLKPEYGHLGYALYPPLFLATALALGLGLAAQLGHGTTPTAALAASRRLATFSSFLYGGFAILAAWLAGVSNLKLLE